jgi:uncharacterized protein (TIGR02452 family)
MKKSMKKHGEDPLVAVWEDTKQIFKQTGHHPSPSEVIPFVKSNRAREPRYPKTVVSVVNTDSLTMTQEILMKTPTTKVLVLNMASDFKPGGGVHKGSRAQEEDLFRRTNMHLTLDKTLLPKNTYPLKDVCMILSPKVTVIKNAEYLRLKEPFTVDFIAVPAIRRPELMIGIENDTYKNPIDCQLMVNKIESIYKIAYDKGYTHLVLGALGCGAFRNPPHAVAKIFHEMNQKYAGCFEWIGFPVLSYGDNENYNIFREVLTPQPEPTIEKK